MKEFAEKTGIGYFAVNIGADPAGAKQLEALGAPAPCVVAGEKWVNCVDIAGVAKLIDAPYGEREILPVEVLRKRYQAIVKTLCRLISRADETSLNHRRPERGHTLLRNL